jgi:hypothetical protein
MVNGKKHQCPSLPPSASFKHHMWEGGGTPGGSQASPSLRVPWAPAGLATALSNICCRAKSPPLRRVIWKVGPGAAVRVASKAFQEHRLLICTAGHCHIHVGTSGHPELREGCSAILPKTSQRPSGAVRRAPRRHIMGTFETRPTKWPLQALGCISGCQTGFHQPSGAAVDM